MKRFLCLLLALVLSAGGFALHALAEESADNEENNVSTEIISSEEPSSEEPSDGPVISNEPSEEPSNEPGEQCEITVNTVGDGDFYYANKEYYKGDTLTLNLSPADGMGVKAVTVNGEEISDFAVDGGAVSIALEGNTDIEVEFAEAVRVIVDWAEGGNVKANGREISNNKGFKVIKGGNLVISITTNANQAIDKVTNDGQDVTNQVRYGRYTIENIESGCVIEISFRETGNTDVKTYTITVNVEGRGTVDPDGRVQVTQGEELLLTITPASGYIIQSISDRGSTVKVSDNNNTGTYTYTVRNIYDNGTVTVIFADPNAGGDVSSEPVDSSAPTETNDDYITRADIEKLASYNEIRIDISAKSKIGKAALEYINQLLKEGKTVEIGVSGEYWWILPENASFATAGLADDGINFGVAINSGSVSEAMKKAIQEKADANKYNHVYNVTIERLSASALPEGTKLKVYMGESFTPGQKLDWLKYDPNTGSFSQMCDTEGALVNVDNSRSATVEMPFPERYGMLVNYIAKDSTVTVTWNQAHCSVSVIGDISLSESGQAVNAISWKSGSDVLITVNVKEGYAIQEISSSDFWDMVLLSNGKDVTTSGAKGITDSVTIKISGISKNGQIIVNTAEAKQADKPSAEVPWDVIILIAVIVIAMVAGGVIFVIKWRQSDDDDDDDDEYYEDDEE